MMLKINTEDLKKSKGLIDLKLENILDLKFNNLTNINNILCEIVISKINNKKIRKEKEL